MNRRKLVAFSLTTITDYCRLTLLTPRAFHLHNMKSSAAQESFSTEAKQKKTFFRAFTPPASVVMYAPLHFSLPQRYTYTLFSLGAIILALPTSRRMSHRIKMRCLPLLATGKWMMLIVKNANRQQSWKPTYSNQIIIYRKKAF